MTDMTELEKARNEINAVDSQMAELFVRRMRAVEMVAAYKRERGLQVTDTAREEEIVSRNSQLVSDELLRGYYIDFLRGNMEISRRYQHRLLDGMRVAFSGISGAFADIAAKRIFPDGISVPQIDFRTAYDSVLNGENDCVILPIENSYAGDVGQVMDLAFFGPLCINGVYDIEVVQNLLAVKGAAIDGITEVISHPQALGQCASYIKRHGFKATESSNTAVAVKQVAELGNPAVAAIGSEEAAQMYGLEKLATHINESSINTTRFAVFSRVPRRHSENDNRFIMMFTVRNEAGSLGKAVSVIGQNGFNLLALKSRPTKELIWDYYFYAEGEGNIYSDNGKKMMGELMVNCSNLKIVGTFEKEMVL